MSRKNLFLQLWAKTFFHNQILALFFLSISLEAINQYLRLLLGGNPQWKKVFETSNTFGWVWPAVSFSQSD